MLTLAGAIVLGVVIVGGLVLLVARMFGYRPDLSSPAGGSRTAKSLALRAGGAPGRAISGFSQRPTGFTWKLLKELEWRSFEKLVTGYFRCIGFQAERLRAGADGGVDIVIRKAGEERIFAYAQCKAWNAYLVGVKPVRELFGVMAADGVTKGYFVTSGTYTTEALAFARDKPLKLVTGAELLEKLNGLPGERHRDLLAEITSDDYTTPTCPSCDTKMVQRKGKDGVLFWGCRQFPKCWRTFPLRTT